MFSHCGKTIKESNRTQDSGYVSYPMLSLSLSPVQDPRTNEKRNKIPLLQSPDQALFETLDQVWQPQFLRTDGNQHKILFLKFIPGMRSFHLVSNAFISACEERELNKRTHNSNYINDNKKYMNVII